MREIISIGIGQYGVNALDAYNEQICKEHKLNQSECLDQVQNQQPEGHMPTHFVEYQTNSSIYKSYTPRSIFIDNDCQSVDKIQSSQQKASLYSIDSFISGSDKAEQVGRNYSSIFYGSGKTLVEEKVMDQVRKQAENSSWLEGSMLFFGINGATGAGIGSLLIRSLREQYCDSMMLVIPILPDPTISNCFEIYNAVLTYNQLVENCDISLLLHNQRLFDIAQQNKYDISKGNSFSQANRQIANTVSDITASERFGGLQNTNLRKIAVNLISFPRLHFFAVASSNPVSSRLNSFQDRMDYLLTNHKQWNCIIPKQSTGAVQRSFAVGAYFRGSNLFSGEISEYLNDSFQKKLNIQYWIPNGAHWSMTGRDRPSHQDSCDNKESATFMINTFSQAYIYQHITEIFSQHFRKKAFVHHYTQHGMDEMEFTEAESNLNDLQSEFLFSNDGYVDIDEEEEFYDGE